MEVSKIVALFLFMFTVLGTVSAGKITPNTAYTNISLIVPKYDSVNDKWTIGYQRDYYDGTYDVREMYVGIYSSDLSTRLYGFNNVYSDILSFYGVGGTGSNSYSPSETHTYGFDIYYNTTSSTPILFITTKNSVTTSAKCSVYRVYYDLTLTVSTVQESNKWGTNWCYDQIAEDTIKETNLFVLRRSGTDVIYTDGTTENSLYIPADVTVFRRPRYIYYPEYAENVVIFEGEVSSISGHYIYANFYDSSWNYLGRQIIGSVNGASKPYIIRVGDYYYLSWIYNSTTFIIDVYEPDTGTHWNLVDEYVYTPTEYTGSKPLTAVSLAYNYDTDEIYVFYAYEDDGIYYQTLAPAPPTTTTTTTVPSTPSPSGITSCGVVINSPGDYYVSQDLYAESGDQCILINSSNVNLDLAGHTIRGNGVVPLGINIYNPVDTLTDVNVYNGKVTYFNYGIGGANLENYTIRDVNVSYNFWGISLVFADNGMVKDVYYEGTGTGVKVFGCSGVTLSDLRLKATGTKPAVELIGVTNSTISGVKTGYIVRKTVYNQTVSGWDFPTGRYLLDVEKACPSSAVDCKSCQYDKFYGGYMCGQMVFDEYSKENYIMYPTFDFVGEEDMAVVFLSGSSNNTVCGGTYMRHTSQVCDASTETCTYELEEFPLMDYVLDYNSGETGNTYNSTCFGMYAPGMCEKFEGWVCLNSTTRAYLTADCVYANVMNCPNGTVCRSGHCLNTTGITGVGITTGNILTSIVGLFGSTLDVDLTSAKYFVWFLISLGLGIAVGHYTDSSYGLIAFAATLGIGVIVGWFPFWYALVLIIFASLMAASTLSRLIVGRGGA